MLRLTYVGYAFVFLLVSCGGQGESAHVESDSVEAAASAEPDAMHAGLGEPDGDGVAATEPLCAVDEPGRCVETNALEACVDGAWVQSACAEGQVCLEGGCRTPCDTLNGDSQCAGDDSHPFCIDGLCRCQFDGRARCAGETAFETCTGDTWARTACDEGEVCVGKDEGLYGWDIQCQAPGCKYVCIDGVCIDGACDQPCVSDEDCVGDTVCYEGSCKIWSCYYDYECGPTEFCLSDVCWDAHGEPCDPPYYFDECPEGLVCDHNFDLCLLPSVPCDAETPCPAYTPGFGGGSMEYVCLEGSCILRVDCLDGSCPSAFACVDELCQPSDNACTPACSDGALCVDGVCVDDQTCVDASGCDAGEMCMVDFSTGQGECAPEIACTELWGCPDGYVCALDSAIDEGVCVLMKPCDCEGLPTSWCDFVTGQCMVYCLSAEDCAEGEICDVDPETGDGACAPAP